MIQVPDSVTVNTGNQHEIENMKTMFFNDVYEHICIREFLPVGATAHPYFEIKSAGLAFENQVTDSRVDYLLYQEAVVAVVMQTRTNLNHIRYDFFLRNI